MRDGCESDGRYVAGCRYFVSCGRGYRGVRKETGSHYRRLEKS